MFKPGTIRKVQVQNFVTYSYVEMYPGPNLNMIIGPNGTGKSTIVAAIILGLGGNPKTVGRGTRISEYVKHDCDHSKINIFLQDKRENAFIKITREFDRHEKSQWKINGRLCSAGEVQECIKPFNIQVNNLCQFLPQDRVTDFAKLNKKELLQETQIALCRTDLVEKQKSLIETRAAHMQLLEQISKHSQKLQEAQDANLRMEGRVKNFNKKKKYKEQISAIDRQLAWLEYEEKRDKLSEIKRDKEQAQNTYNRYRDEIKPVEREINVFKGTLDGMQQSNSKVMQNIRTYEGHINSIHEKIEDLTAKVREIEDEMMTKLEENNQWDRQIEESVAKIEDMRKIQKTLLAKFNQGSDQKHAVTSEITKCMNRIKQLQDQRETTEQLYADSKGEIRALQHEQSRIENVKQMRFEHLRRINADAATAVHWLRINKHLFKGEVYEPIMLEINVLDSSKAKYVEAMVPLRDRLAFTCTDKSDMNLLIRTLREQQRLSVNVLHSGPASDAYNQPRIPIERLRKFGFYTYVNTLFTAPEPIMRYLCETYRLHNIPVGDGTTNNCYESVPQEISLFFSDKFRFAIHFSKYSREKSSRQNLVTGDGGLSLLLDVVRLENIQGRCNEARRKAENLESQLANFDKEIQNIEEQIRSFREKLIEGQKQKQQCDALEKKIVTSQERLKEMRNNKKSPDEIRAESRRKMKKMIESMGLLQEGLKDYFQKLEESVTKSNLHSVRVDALMRKTAYMESQITEAKSRIREAEETLALVMDKYNASMQETKALLRRAKELSNGFTPADDGFDVFREVYDLLGSKSKQELNEEKENLKSRISCLNTADDEEIRDYEERANLIDKLGATIDAKNAEVNEMNVKMERLQREWLTPLQDVIAGINLRFASSFERMGCAGEVGICQGDDEKDYSEYGISIKVTYRSGEPLQELNATVQSGGERAVATAAFMLALQGLTPVPFRCVDEINQGMDANNERRIFELVVETTCQQQNTSQYFLITPKLVPNLDYPRQMMVHIVHNGPFINPDQKWSASKLCNPQAVQIQ